MKKFLNTAQAAEILGVSIRRVQAKLKQGHFPSAKHCGCEKNNWLILEAEVKKRIKMKTLNHVTISTGHNRVSPRSEVSEDALDLCTQIIEESLNESSPIPIPIAGLENFKIQCSAEKRILLVVIYGAATEEIEKKLNLKDVPLLTFAVAPKNSDDNEFWLRFCTNPPEKPEAPWCAVYIHQFFSMFADSCDWLGDFERCIAWAWIE